MKPIGKAGLIICFCHCEARPKQSLSCAALILRLRRRYRSSQRQKRGGLLRSYLPRKDKKGGLRPSSLKLHRDKSSLSLLQRYVNKWNLYEWRFWLNRWYPMSAGRSFVLYPLPGVNPKPGHSGTNSLLLFEGGVQFLVVHLAAIWLINDEFIKCRIHPVSGVRF